MISLSIATEYAAPVQAAIHSQPRMHELITEAETGIADIVIDEKGYINWQPAWDNTQPPVLFTPQLFEPRLLLGFLYTRLGNYEQAYSFFSTHPEMKNTLEWLLCIREGWDQAPAAIIADNYFAKHNNAIAAHYMQPGTDMAIRQYRLALQGAPDREYFAFTSHQAAAWLIDHDRSAEAIDLLDEALAHTVRAEAKFALSMLRCQVAISLLQAPYNEGQMQQLKQTLWECLEYYESKQRTVETALLLQEASYIAGVENSFSEALGYINRAIALFEQEALEGLVAEATLRKGNLLKNWAQTGQPQFFRPAMQAYLDSLKVFTREVAPPVFATVQHQLGIVYSEIPDEVKKKGVWAAVSVSAFQEALSFYNKIEYPYQFGTICNDFGNAYTRYPASLHTDNFDKALAWYREALDVQQGDQYPLERVLTLMNYLDASWYAANQSDFDENRYADMVQRASEVLQLSTDSSVKEAALRHLRQLEELRQSCQV